MQLLLLEPAHHPGPEHLRAQLDRLGRRRSWVVTGVAIGRIPVGADGGVDALGADRHVAEDLAALADRLATLAIAGDDVTVIAGDVIVPDGALLGVVEDARRPVSALVGARAVLSGDVGGHPVATEAAVILAVGTPRHPVTGADAEFLGVIRLAAGCVRSASDALRAAADTARHGQWSDDDPTDVALGALVRTGPPVAAVRLDPYEGGRAATPDAAAALRARIEATDEAAVEAMVARVRATRLDDGFYSTFVLRRISPHLSRRCVGRAITANRVTLVSAGVGLAAAASFAAGSWWTLLVGAVLLQVSLVLDCVDGEIARATRTFSAFGAWLDAATDRVKEYAALAGLAAGAARSGPDLWGLALAAMVVQTVRHMQDFSFDQGVLAAARAPRPDRRPLSDTEPWVRPPGSVPSRPTGASRALSRQEWLRRIVHMPIAERWLVLSVGAALDRPRLAVGAYLGLGVLAEAWTAVGALRRSTGAVGRYGAELRRRLGEYRDDGVLARWIHDRSPAGVLGWLLAPLVTAAEGAVLLVTSAHLGTGGRAWAFAWFALVAWHRYDLAYRRRDRSTPVPAFVNDAGGGWLVRIAVVLAAASAGQLPVVLIVGVIWLGVVYLPESVAAGLRSRRPAASAGPRMTGGNA